MYKLMVVDDEEIIRNGISRGIKWTEIGFEVCGEAANGFQAIEQIRQNLPDVVILDICMPGMDGIQLMEHISKNYSGIKMVVLSGYKEFEYAQKAIGNNVLDYLLKPTHINSFIGLFSKIKTELDKERQKIKELEELKNSINENNEYLKQIFLNRLIAGEYMEASQIINKIDFYGLSIKSNTYTVFVMETDSSMKKNGDFCEEGKQLFDLSLAKTAGSMLNSAINMETFIGPTGGVIGIYEADNGLQCLISNLEKVQNEVFLNTGLTISIGISEIFDNILLIHQAYLQAKEAITHKIRLGRQSLILYSDIKSMFLEDTPEIYFDVLLINSCILHMKLDQLEKYIDSVFESIGNKVFKSAEFIDTCIQKIVFNVENNLKQYGLVIDEIFYVNHYSFGDIYGLDTLEAKSGWLNNVLADIARYLDKKRENRFKGLVVEIQKYVDRNFCDNSLSLDRVADKFSKSPQYISKLFKDNIGKNFSEYVTGLRIEKAELLLKDFTVKISDISEMIGYADISYFTKKFRSFTGVSPSQYRNNTVQQG